MPAVAHVAAHAVLSLALFSRRPVRPGHRGRSALPGPLLRPRCHELRNHNPRQLRNHPGPAALITTTTGAAAAAAVGPGSAPTTPPSATATATAIVAVVVIALQVPPAEERVEPPLQYPARHPERLFVLHIRRGRPGPAGWGGVHHHVEGIVVLRGARTTHVAQDRTARRAQSADRSHQVRAVGLK